jgi:hypothetical protein
VKATTASAVRATIQNRMRDLPQGSRGKPSIVMRDAKATVRP